MNKSKQYFKKHGFSISPQMLEAAKRRAALLGFGNSFSAYVQRLIERDLGWVGGVPPSPPTVPPKDNPELFP